MADPVLTRWTQLMFVLFALHVGIDIYKKDVTHQDR